MKVLYLSLAFSDCLRTVLALVFSVEASHPLQKPNTYSPVSYGRGEKEGERGSAWARDQTWMPTRCVGCKSSIFTHHWQPRGSTHSQKTTHKCSILMSISGRLTDGTLVPGVH